MKKVKAVIRAIEEYFPSKRLTNTDLAKMVETDSAWILERTGIQERRIASAEETTASMGAAAAAQLFKNEQIDPKSIDLIITATITPDQLVPATSALIQERLGCSNAWGFDLAAACSGYLYALETARAFIESQGAKRVLVIATEKMSSIIDFQDRQTCILFGDGGSATLVEASHEGPRGILASLLKMDGSGAPALMMPAGGSKQPATLETVQQRLHYVKQDGRTVFKRAVTEMAGVCAELLEREKVDSKSIDLFVPHQANLRIIQAALDRLDIPLDKVALNLERFGNTTAATIPTAWRDAQKKGQAKPGQLVLLTSFGAGYTWGSMLIQT